MSRRIRDAQVNKKIGALKTKKNTIAVDALEEDVQVFEACWKLSPHCRADLSLAELRGSFEFVRQKKRLTPPIAVHAGLVSAFVRECIQKEGYDAAAEALCPWALGGKKDCTRLSFAVLPTSSMLD